MLSSIIGLFKYLQFVFINMQLPVKVSPCNCTRKTSQSSSSQSFDWTA